MAKEPGDQQVGVLTVGMFSYDARQDLQRGSDLTVELLKFHAQIAASGNLTFRQSDGLLSTSSGVGPPAAAGKEPRKIMDVAQRFSPVGSYDLLR